MFIFTYCNSYIIKWILDSLSASVMIVSNQTQIDSCTRDVVKVIITKLGQIKSPSKKIMAQFIYNEFDDWDEEFFICVLNQLKSKYPKFYNALIIPKEWDGGSQIHLNTLKQGKSDGMNFDYNPVPIDSAVSIVIEPPDIDVFIRNHPEWIKNNVKDETCDLVYYCTINGNHIFAHFYSSQVKITDKNLSISNADYLAIPYQSFLNYKDHHIIIFNDKKNSAAYFQSVRNIWSFINTESLPKKTFMNLVQEFQTRNRTETPSRYINKDEKNNIEIQIPKEAFIPYSRNNIENIAKINTNLVICPKCRQTQFIDKQLNFKDKIKCKCSYEILAFMIEVIEKSKKQTIERGSSRETMFIDVYLSHQKGFTYQKRDAASILDYTILKGEQVDHYLEIRERFCTLNMYRTTRIPLNKMLEGQRIFNKSKIKSYILIKFLDCWTIYEIKADFDYESNAFMWGRGDRPYEQAKYVEIPIEDLTILDWTDYIEL